MADNQHTPYNLRENPKRSQKALDNEAANDIDIDAQPSTAIHHEDHEKNQNNETDILGLDESQQTVTLVPGYINQIFTMIRQLNDNVGTLKHDFTQITRTLECRFQDGFKEMNNRFDEQKIEMQKITQQFDHKLEQVEYKWENQFKSTQQYVKSTIDELSNTVENNAEEIKNIKYTFKDTNQTLTTRMEEHNEKTTSTLNEYVQTLKKLENRNTHIDLSDITIQCKGNNLDIPKFSGRASNPKEFLQHLERHYDRMKDKKTISKVNQKEFLHETIEDSLENYALKWWQLVKDKVNTWEEFSDIFINKYWSMEVQMGVKRRIELDRYKPGGRLSRAEYFVERVITLQSLTPTPSDQEILAMLTGHFCEMIQGAKRLQNITTIQDFELMLQREDNLDQLEMRMTQNNKNEIPPYRNNPSPTNNNDRRVVNHRAYEPRKFDPPKNRIPFENRNQNHYEQNRNQTSYNNNRYPQAYNRDRNMPNRTYPTREQVQACQIVSDRSPIRNQRNHDQHHESNTSSQQHLN